MTKEQAVYSPSMNYVDILLALPMFWGAYKGFKRGILIELALFAALFTGLYAAVKFSDYTSIFLHEQYAVEEQYLPFISFLVTFGAVVLAILFFAKLLERVLMALFVNIFNQLAGLLFGMIKMALIMSVVINLFLSINTRTHLVSQSKFEGSYLFEPLSKLAPLIIPKFDEIDLFHFLQSETDPVI